MEKTTAEVTKNQGPTQQPSELPNLKPMAISRILNPETEDEAEYQMHPIENPMNKKDASQASSSQHRRFSCQLCENKFYQERTLQQHVKAVHYKIKDKKCKYQGCDKKYSSHGDLTRHIDSFHLRNRSFVCECGLSFTRMGSLRRHKKTKQHEN